MGLGTIVGMAISSALALIVLLGYAPLKSSILGISYSPRLMAVWLIPLVDIVVTLYLIGGGWFGLGGDKGFMMTMNATATCLGLSGCAFVVRKLFAPRWRREYQLMKRRGQ
jgi:hypothetical protein